MLTGEAAGAKAGPAVALSFVFSGIACALAALCYAEFASTVPVAGSAYTFSYASLGELVAWIIGWDLILELALGASTVAVGWSTYFADVMDEAGITIPAWAYGEKHNLVAAVIVIILTGVICLGIKISSQVNFVMVVIKLSIRHDDLGGCAGRTDDSDDDPVAGTKPGLLRDEPRPVVAADVLKGQRAVRDAGPHIDHDWCHRRRDLDVRAPDRVG